MVDGRRVWVAMTARWTDLVREFTDLMTLVPTSPSAEVARHIRHGLYVIAEHDEEALEWVPRWRVVFEDALEYHVIQITRAVVDMSGIPAL